MVIALTRHKSLLNRFSANPHRVSESSPAKIMILYKFPYLLAFLSQSQKTPNPDSCYRLYHILRKLEGGEEIVAERETGTVKWFNRAKGFGFITRNEGGDIFVHYSEIRGEGFRSLEEGQQVEFTVMQAEKGPQAQDVIVLA